MLDLGFVSYGLAATSFLILTLLLLTSWQGRAQGARLVVACAVTAAWAALLAFGSDRVDLTLPPQHPDAPAPEIHFAGPDDIVSAVSEPLALDATGTSLTATVTTDGKQTILVRTSKGTGRPKSCSPHGRRMQRAPGRLSVSTRGGGRGGKSGRGAS